MKLRSAVLAALAGTAALSAPAFADNGRHRGHYYNGHPYYHGYAYAPRIVYAPAPAYYAPVPVYRPAPVMVSPAISIRFRLPL